MTHPVGVIACLWLAVWPAWVDVSSSALAFSESTAISHAERPVRDDLRALLDLSDEELRTRVEADPGSLGSLSIGSPGSAILIDAVSLPAGPRWEIAPSADTFGTAETMVAIETVVDKVHELYPDTPPLFIGDISDADGGRLKRHESHQGGRDVDLGYYYNGGKGTWFAPGTVANLDMPRNWALVRALLTETDVEVIFLDTRIQRLLYTYAASIGEDRTWLDRVFQFSRGSRDAIIAHVPGHRTHYHVRFYNPVAQELGRRTFPFLVDAAIVRPPVFTVKHLVATGQTLGHLAGRYGTSIRAIMQANGMTTTQLRAGHYYRIPVRAAAPPVKPLVVPLRMLPPVTPVVLAAAEWPTMESMYGDRLASLTQFPGLFGFVRCF